MEKYTSFKDWLRSRKPDISDRASIGVFLSEVDDIVEKTYHKSGTDTGVEVSKLLDYKIFKRDLLKGVLEWLFTYQKEFKSVPYEYTSRDNRRDWEHEKHGWSRAISEVIIEFRELKKELKGEINT